MGATSWFVKAASVCGSIMKMGAMLGKILGFIRDFTVGITVPRFLKLITSLCTLILMAVAISLLALGLWHGKAALALALFPSLHYLEKTISLSTACITIGSILLFFGALGLLGVYREGKWLLVVYCVLVPITALGLYSISGMVAYGISHKVEDVARLEGAQYLRTEYGTDEKFTTELNSVMGLLQCCGVNNATDFESPPQSCCSDEGVAPSCALYPQGCMDAFLSFIRAHRSLMLGLLIAVLVALPLSSLTSGFLARHLHVRDKKKIALESEGKVPLI